MYVNSLSLRLSLSLFLGVTFQARPDVRHFQARIYHPPPMRPFSSHYPPPLLSPPANTMIYRHFQATSSFVRSLARCCCCCCRVEFMRCCSTCTLRALQVPGIHPTHCPAPAASAPAPAHAPFSVFKKSNVKTIKLFHMLLSKLSKGCSSAPLTPPLHTVSPPTPHPLAFAFYWHFTQ